MPSRAQRRRKYRGDQRDALCTKSLEARNHAVCGAGRRPRSNLFDPLAQHISHFHIERRNGRAVEDNAIDASVAQQRNSTFDLPRHSQEFFTATACELEPGREE